MAPTIVTAGRLHIEIRTREGKHMRPHAHAVSPNPKSPEAEASIALDTFEVLESSGFNEPTLNRIVNLVKKHATELRETWEEYHD